MSIELAIWEQWSAYKPLADLVPENRVWQGAPPQEDEDQESVDKPYVFLLAENPESTRTSDNTYTMASLQMRVYAETSAEAEQISNVARDYFNDLGATWSRGTIIDCKHNGTTREQDEDDGTWNLLLTFMVHIQEARRAAVFR